MSATELRQAAVTLRANPYTAIRGDAPAALADWLDTAGADVWAYGPPEPEDQAGDDDLLNPHLIHALKVARLINGGNS